MNNSNDNIPYDTIKGLLVGDYGSEDDLIVVLNFLGHTASVLRILHLAQQVKDEQRELNNKKSKEVK